MKSKKILAFIVIPVVLIIAIFVLYIGMKSQKEKRIKEAEKSIVTVFAYDYFGNEIATGGGFAAFEKNVVVTNYHVIDGAYTVSIQTTDNKSVPVEYALAADESKDLVIIKTQFDLELTPLTSENLELLYDVDENGPELDFEIPFETAGELYANASKKDFSDFACENNSEFEVLRILSNQDSDGAIGLVTVDELKKNSDSFNLSYIALYGYVLGVSDDEKTFYIADSLDYSGDLNSTEENWSTSPYMTCYSITEDMGYPDCECKTGDYILAIGFFSKADTFDMASTQVYYYRTSDK